MAALPILVDSIIAKESRSALIWIKKSAFFRSANQALVAVLANVEAGCGPAECARLAKVKRKAG